MAAIEPLGDAIPRAEVERVWADAMATSWERDPVWVHGDVAAGNLLVRDGRLAAVIDFGSSGVGDPACDTVIAWTFLSEPSRDRFRRGRRHLGTRPRLGPVERVDHARGLRRAGRAGGGAAAPRHRAHPRGPGGLNYPTGGRARAAPPLASPT